MAMVPCTVHAAVGAAGFLASSALPAAFHGSKVWSRAYTQVLSSHHREPEAGPTNKSNSTWAFSPAARELVREAGGFDGGRHWPLGSSTSLLSHRGQLHFTNPHNHLFWHYSIAPKHAEASLASQSLHTAALELQKQEQTVVEQKFPVSHSWYDKVRLVRGWTGRELWTAYVSHVNSGWHLSQASIWHPAVLGLTAIPAGAGVSTRQGVLAQTCTKAVQQEDCSSDCTASDNRNPCCR